MRVGKEKTMDLVFTNCVMVSPKDDEALPSMIYIAISLLSPLLVLVQFQSEKLCA